MSFISMLKLFTQCAEDSDARLRRDGNELKVTPLEEVVAVLHPAPVVAAATSTAIPTAMTEAAALHVVLRRLFKPIVETTPLVVVVARRAIKHFLRRSLLVCLSKK